MNENYHDCEKMPKEYRNSIYINYQRKWVFILNDVVYINNCPFCGRKLE